MHKMNKKHYLVQEVIPFTGYLETKIHFSVILANTSKVSVQSVCDIKTKHNM